MHFFSPSGRVDNICSTITVLLKCTLVCLVAFQDKVFCKAILNEYAVKRSIERPSYNTVKPEGSIPIFRSTLVFNGVSYTGDTSSNKKEAEQLAAHAAILSLMGNLYFKYYIFC